MSHIFEGYQDFTEFLHFCAPIGFQLLEIQRIGIRKYYTMTEVKKVVLVVFFISSFVLTLPFARAYDQEHVESANKVTTLFTSKLPTEKIEVQSLSKI